MKSPRTSRCLLVFICLLLGLLPSPASAISDRQKQLLNMGQGDYLDIDINNDCAKTPRSVSGSDGQGGMYERLDWAIETYGKAAMEAQREYGVPWEMVFAQMLKESGVGTATNTGAVNLQVEEAGGYNWLGIRGTGDAGSANGWAVFSTVEKMITAWAGSYVLRNGMYDKAFTHLDPNNYDLAGFIKTVIPIYAPSSDGNDPEGYANEIINLIDGHIKDKVYQLGWRTSAELARDEQIPIGGRHPLNSAVGDSETSSSMVCPPNKDFLDDAKWTYFNQCDSNVIDYYMCTIGCMPASVAMIIANLLDNSSLTPKQLQANAAAKFPDTDGDGLLYNIAAKNSRDAQEFIRLNYGSQLATKQLGNIGEVKAALRNGALVLGAVRGHTSDMKIHDTAGAGHFYVIRGIDNEGNWKLADPSKTFASSGLGNFSEDDVDKALKTGAGYSGGNAVAVYKL